MAKNYRVNWANLPEDPDGMTFADVKRAYTRLHKELAQEKRMKGATESVLSRTTKDMRKARGEAKHLKRDMIQLTKKQKANDELKSCGAWSGAAIGCVTVLWAGFAEYGYPGPAWLFEHEFVYGSVCWFTTMTFGWAAKAFHST
jgi:hypothetical protein